ncbi:MAG TPA: hypothetical protein VIG33_02230 [Pseudobdellovibrionaceae bacterium]|jgi:hypothetical protein
MDSRIHSKASFYLMAVVALVVLSACGEKKSARGSQPIEVPKTNTTGSDQPLPAPSGGGVELPLPQAPGPNPPGPLKDVLDEDSDYDPVDPKAVEKADFQKRYTGMGDDEGLLYTGSSTDYILTYLRLRNEDPNLDADVKARNLEAAQSIESARLSHDKITGDLLVSLKVREGNNLKSYVLTGGLSDGDTLSSLRLAKGSGGGRGKTTGAQHIEGKIRCMDSDGGCDTTVARLVIGDHPGTRAAVAIVFRESLADVYFSLSAATGNPEYDVMRKFWIHSNDEANTDLRLKEAVLKSFEIVNGRSGFDVQIKSYGQQLLSFGGPLLAPDAGTSVSMRANRNAELKESLDLDGLTDYKFDLANFIGSAKIVNNNGLGQVRLAVKMRKRVGYRQESFSLTLMRIIKPTLNPNQENLKLN